MKPLAISLLITLLSIGSASADYAGDLESSRIDGSNSNYTTMPATAAAPSKSRNEDLFISPDFG